MDLPRWLKRWLGWEAVMFQHIREELRVNTAAQLALSTSIAAVAKGVADLATAIANHPVVQADDSGDILKAAEELTGFSTQLESMATSLGTAGAGDPPPPPPPPPPPSGDVTGGDPTGGAPAGDPPAPEAGSAEGPGTLEPGPATV